MPIGIEVEVPWKAYFPDLWVEGFPNVDDEELRRITMACEEREETLLPRLYKTVECGVPRGCDRYWEFAFDPVTDVSIVVDQLSIIRDSGLMPGNELSLHVTFGGLKVDRDLHYVALILEAFACSPQRVLSAFHQTSTVMSKGWARKGYAGLFQKEGDHDIQHGYGIGAELRMLYLPETDDQLFNLLDDAQLLAEVVYRQQRDKHSNIHWKSLVAVCSDVLTMAGLPDSNWKKPHIEPKIWERFAEQLPSIQRSVRKAYAHYKPLILQSESLYV